eukprot:TRINITY_DN47107_c0_g1_i1.p1 TRINITY_DN47107_c0_g1~~TRINITY_DN47107_c0_g1_i1.p1  ORF type:complete len:354 (+),score=56.71 TRINITY_DN47107_c0_g1_i1:87-1064(+)
MAALANGSKALAVAAFANSSATKVHQGTSRVSLGSTFVSANKAGSIPQSAFFHGRDAWRLQTAASSTAGNGGALAAQMNIFDRVSRIVKSYTNAALSSLEDPEKMLDQTVEDMQNDLIKLRQATAQVLASTKMLENKYKAAQQNSDDWYARAKLALEKGEEQLAKEALKRRKEFEENARSLESQLAQQQGTAEKLISNTRLLESKISEAKAKKDTLKARAQSAKTQQKVNELVGGISTSSSLAAFEKMEEKVLALEADSEAVGQLTSDDLSSKFALLEAGTVDDDLAALKREMLPPGRSEAPRPSLKDLEVEAELNELRRKAREF